MDNHQIRLNKFLSERLGISRREADEAIVAGKVTINGRTAILGDRITVQDNQTEPNLAKMPKVCYNESIVPLRAEYLYLAFNKPVGYVCSRRAQGSAPTLYELLPPKYQKLKTVGRLDKDSSGLILLTNDGDFAFQMTHPKFHKEKIYEVTLDRLLEPLHQQMISDYGVMLDDGPSRFIVVRKVAEISSEGPPERGSAGMSAGRPWQTAPWDADDPKGRRAGRTQPEDNILQPTYTVILSEGRNRQIRRTFAALGYKVTKLHRTQFGKYILGGLQPGSYEEFKI